MSKPFKEVIKDAEQSLMDLRVASVQIGKQIERERIIKLLNRKCVFMNCDKTDGWCVEIKPIVIALIKGEK